MVVVSEAMGLHMEDTVVMVQGTADMVIIMEDSVTIIILAKIKIQISLKDSFRIAICF